MTLRPVLENLLLTSAAAGVEGESYAPAPAGRTVSVRIPPVLVSGDRILRTTVGFRPFRPSGFVLKTEKLGEKLLVHNYGHGGGGMTLSWGTADLATQMALESGAREVAVVGAGGVGLATARLLQRRGIGVTLYAKALPPDTTSNQSGAHWWPVSVFDRDHLTPEFRVLLLRAAYLSYEHFERLLGERYGVRRIRNYWLSEEPMPELDLPGHPFASRYVRQFDTMMIEPAVYLDAMLRDFKEAGGRIVMREFRSKEEWSALPQSVVMNCTGLGSRELAGDTGLIPIKGQLTVLRPQPEIDYALLHDRHYMFPRRDGILLGGTFERGVVTPEPNREAEKRVIEAHRRIFAPLLVSPLDST